MTDDLLKEATRALREEGEEAQGSDLTRARVMLSLHAAKRKRRSRLAFGVPLAAVLVAGAAAAQVTGALPRAVDRVVEVFSGGEVSEPPSEPKQVGGRPLVSSTPSEPDPVPPPEEVDPAAEPSELGEPEDAEQAEEIREESEPTAPTVAKAAPAPPLDVTPYASEAKPAKPEPSAQAGKDPAPASSAGAPAASAPPAVTDPSHRRYLEAHQAHFSAHDYARALTLWDRYLQEFPRGRFAAEAQYNRALCLVRLGRTAEAKRALEPFASGRYGGYRQTEAQALIEALGGS